MARDMTNQLNQRPDWETMPKKGEGSEFGREAKEIAKRRRFGGHAPKKINPEDQPWVLSNKGGDKSAKQLVVFTAQITSIIINLFELLGILERRVFQKIHHILCSLNVVSLGSLK